MYITIRCYDECTEFNAPWKYGVLFKPLKIIITWVNIISMFSVKVKGTMSSATRREALTHINTMEEEMKIATERLKEMTEEKEAERMKVNL